MAKNSISFKTILIIIGAYAAYGIGSGFATGQEVLQYFGSWGVGGSIIALICSALVVAYSFSSLVKAGQMNEDLFKKDSDCYAYYGGKAIGMAIDVFSWILVFFILIAMFAGCGATVNQYFGIPVYVGTIVMMIVCGLVVMLGLHRIQQILGFLGIVFIIYIVLFGIFALATADQSLSESVKNLPQYLSEGKILQAGIFGIYHPVWAGLNYGGVCLITAFPFVVALGRRTSNPLEARVSGFNAGLWFHIPAFFAAVAIMLHMDYIAANGNQVPLLAAITDAMPGLSWTFVIILLLGIFTTITGYMWFVVDRIAEEGTSRYRILAVVAALVGGIGGSFIPFNTVINLIFPITGIVGMFLTVLIIIKEIRLKAEKNAGLAE